MEVPSTFNARAETVADKPTFRDAFKRSQGRHRQPVERDQLLPNVGLGKATAHCVDRLSRLPKADIDWRLNDLCLNSHPDPSSVLV